MHDSEQEHSGITGCRVTYESTIFYNEANKFSIIVVKTNDPRIPLQACNGRYYGDRMLRFTAVGVTGSGRERVGKRIGADAVRDEITAQAKGAAHWVPEADTVFEIGGQDSKYISIQNGEVVDFQMNKICAAGTGSFVEEQAARMGIPLAEFGPLALSSEHPASLGERCTVFIETAIASASAEGISRADIAAGLCHSIVQNYLHKVVGSKPVGQHIVLQGGVDYNPGIVAAFQSAYGDRVQVSPVFSISGAYGAALLAQEAVGDALSRFVGFDSPAKDAEDWRRAGKDAAAGSLHFNPEPILFATVFAASCAFMMPVGTPPNAIVFGTGRIRIGDMVKAGIWLNFIAVIIGVLVSYFFGRGIVPMT